MTEIENDKIYGLFSTPNNKKIIAELEAQNKKTLILPSVESQRIQLADSTLEKILNFANFDWIVFSDVLTVDYFLEILEENEIDLFELDEVRICAFGEAVSDRLRFVQIHTDVLPTKINNEQIIESIKNYVNNKNRLNGQRILLLRQDNLRLSITEMLMLENADILELPIYRLDIETPESLPKIKALISGGAIDEFIISTPEEIIFLTFILSEEILRQNLFEQFSVMNETVFKNLFEHGIRSNFIK